MEIPCIVFIVIVLIGAYSFDKYKTNKKKEISNKFNSTVLTYSENTKNSVAKNLANIIEEKDPTYSPLSLYFIIDNKLIYDQAEESDLLNILNPLINSESVWKSHALYLMAEYFYSKDQKQKAKEFFNQIISMDNPNSDIRLQAEKRLNRDLSE